METLTSHITCFLRRSNGVSEARRVVCSSHDCFHCWHPSLVKCTLGGRGAISGEDVCIGVHFRKGALGGRATRVGPTWWKVQVQDPKRSASNPSAGESRREEMYGGDWGACLRKGSGWGGMCANPSHVFRKRNYKECASIFLTPLPLKGGDDLLANSRMRSPRRTERSGQMLVQKLSGTSVSFCLTLRMRRGRLDPPEQKSK